MKYVMSEPRVSEEPIAGQFGVAGGSICCWIERKDLLVHRIGLVREAKTVVESGWVRAVGVNEDRNFGDTVACKNAGLPNTCQH